MQTPTLYFLKVTEHVTGGYEIWEQHMCQSPGCFKTQPEFVEFAETKDHALAIVNDWRINPPLNGRLEEVEWDLIPHLPNIDETEVNDNFRGRYSDLTEMMLAICEISNISAYRVVDTNGKVRYYTFMEDI